MGKYVLGVSRSLKMANAMFAESRSCTLHSSREMRNKDSPVIPLQFSESCGFARRLFIKA
jgi:hypothetical protein